MSIEEKLTNEFARKSQQLNGTGEMDPKVMGAYRKSVMKGRKSLLRGSFGTTRWTIGIVIAVVLLSGFAYGGSKLLMEDKFGQWSFQLRTSSEEITLDDTTAKEVRESIAEIRAHLQPGESAYIYSAALAESPQSFIRIMGTFGIYQPVEINDWERAMEMLKAKTSIVNMPRELPDQFVFQSAHQGGFQYDIPVIVPPDMVDKLQKESEDTGKQVTWMRALKDSHIPGDITFIYSNALNEQITITIRPITSDRTTQKMIAPKSVQYETFKVNGMNAHYTSNSQFFLSNSNYFQNLMWTQVNGKAQYVINAGSDSPKVKKETLVQTAKLLE
ncbi:hypothetical protein [Paenibacillus sp. L3-i20]|uniref:hypothetical protein n=1 Tax=Paenibacillus sp. L3-i20 TaxID=2905833 RepID=UPI001EDDB4FB|nr:hypothetical protein [Paenibacillus sp. L3-i20]GKU77520.1 hypothetical protein L3i20_v219170 [Paenibacillus sp. L3-i20]